MSVRISFEEPGYTPVELSQGAELSELLTIENSPILFGCRIGICGTCAIEIVEVPSTEHLGPRSDTESEYLEAICPDRPQARLACQLKADCNFKLRKIRV